MALTPAQQQLAADNRKLAYHFAGKFYRQTGIDKDELEGEALAALCKAAGQFDPTRGFKFSTYASRSIINRLIRFAELERRQHFTQADDLDWIGREDEGHELDVGEQLERIRLRMDGRLFKVLVDRFMDGKTLREIAERLGLSKERVRQLAKKALAAARGG